MRLASYNVRGRTSYGAVVGNGVVDLRLRLGARHPTLVDLLRAHGLDDARAAVRGVRPDFAFAEIELLAPLLAPEKILCVGINYANRNADFDDPNVPKYPSMFYRAPNSLVAHGKPLLRPRASEQLDYEGEIALVIGREGRHIPRERALEHVAGVMLCNEGTVRDWLHHGKFNVTQGKNFDASGSIGPWMATDVDLTQPLHLTVRVNDEVTQDDTTASMIFGFADLIAYITRFMTLKPGDVLVTGTPVKLGPRSDPPRWLVPGDVVELSVPEIGTLRNHVADEL
ncbi:MAG TPA: fumarylacetoacetate hydrolase family protein [Xanthobacteraceae bacterium]|jgi:2-keto-4-pentenoate hydratase/2-oxohepta-3-ene-1,7-dioic acid hydratase in catechol pathway